MGHSSVTTTERYAHLKPDLYRATVYTTLAINMAAPKGDVVAIPATVSRMTTTAEEEDREAAATA